MQTIGTLYRLQLGIQDKSLKSYSSDEDVIASDSKWYLTVEVRVKDDTHTNTPS